MKQLVVKANEVITYASRNVVMNGCDSPFIVVPRINIIAMIATVIPNKYILNVIKSAFDTYNNESKQD